MKKILISEKILKELQTRRNDSFDYSAYSNVYFGDNWVKKFSYSEDYSEVEMCQFKLMAANPDIFPETRIKKLKKGTLILQRKINVDIATKIYDVVSYPINDFRGFLEDIAREGIDEDISEIIELNRVNKWFMAFVEIVLKLHKLLQEKPCRFPHRIDLHNENFGIENGKLKIIDFLAPRP